MDYSQAKAEILAAFDDRSNAELRSIRASAGTHQAKAKAVNAVVNQIYSDLYQQFEGEPVAQDRQDSLIILNYCYAVKALDYRNSVWQYEYMALSRRVGELWERFCKAAWDSPTRENVARIDAPEFSDVIQAIHDRMLSNTKHEARQTVEADMGAIRDLIGTINMAEDEMFSVNDVPHIIDFKSGFGSNEKGNMLRLRAVGKAYKLWNPETKLLFLVRQTQNNNYLEVIRKEALWDVRCGIEAYNTIDELTGARFSTIRQDCVDFDADLSDAFLEGLDGQLSNLKNYFVW
jgi:hypothetical protein